MSRRQRRGSPRRVLSVRRVTGEISLCLDPLRLRGRPSTSLSSWPSSRVLARALAGPHRLRDPRRPCARSTEP
jgi:hypothetical protein